MYQLTFQAGPKEPDVTLVVHVGTIKTSEGCKAERGSLSLTTASLDGKSTQQCQWARHKCTSSTQAHCKIIGS